MEHEEQVQFAFHAHTQFWEDTTVEKKRAIEDDATVVEQDGIEDEEANEPIDVLRRRKKGKKEKDDGGWKQY